MLGMRWMTEVALWFHRFEHRGKLCARAPSELFTMDAGSFRTITCQHTPELFSGCKHYASAYQELAEQLGVSGNVPCEIWCSLQDVQEITRQAFDRHIPKRGIHGRSSTSSM